MKAIVGERRKDARILAAGLRGLLIRAPNTDELRHYPARLVDFSAGGFGVDMLVPLSIGTSVFVNCNYRCGDCCMDLRGWARIAYCRHVEAGLFRVGITFTDFGCYNLFSARKSGRDAAGEIETLTPSSFRHVAASTPSSAAF